MNDLDKDASESSFGEILTHLMSARPPKGHDRWTDGMLAGRIATTTATIANYRRGRSWPSAKTLRAIVSVLGLERDNPEHQSTIIDLEDALERRSPIASPNVDKSLFHFASSFPSLVTSPIRRSDISEWLDISLIEKRKGLLSLIASGGSGKTTAVRSWLEENKQALRKRFSRVFLFSFYRQGQTREFVDVDLLFEALAVFLRIKVKPSDSTRAKARACLNALLTQSVLLVIDGIESLQVPPGGESTRIGRFKNDDAQEFFDALSMMTISASIVTSRVPVVLSNRDGVDQTAQFLVRQLSQGEAIALLRSYGIDGSDDEIVKYVAACRGHALTLSLVGTFIQRAYKDGLPSLDELSLNETGVIPEAARAERVMAGYLAWLPPAEAALLSLCGLFDQPVNGELVWQLAKALHADKNYPFHLLQNYRIFRFHLETLKSTDLVYDDDANPEFVDTHPMIKEYLGNVFRKNKTQTWIAANRALFDLLEGEYAPTWIIRRIVFGCRGQLAQRAFDEVYRSTVSRYAEPTDGKIEFTDGQILYALNAFFDHGSPSGIVDTLRRDAKQTLLLDAISTVTTLRGYADRQLPSLFSRAHDLARPDDFVSWRIRYAECRFHRMAGNLQASKNDFEAILNAGSATKDKSLLVGGLRNACAYYFYVSDFETSKKMALEGEAAGYSGNWRTDRIGFVNNPVVMLSGYAALAAAMLNQPREVHEATRRMRGAIRDHADSHSSAIASFIEAMLSDFGFGEFSQRDTAIKFEKAAAKGELVQWLIAANILRAAAENAPGEIFSRLIRRWTETGAKLFVPYWCALAAEASNRLEDRDAVQSFSARGLAAARASGESWANSRLEVLTRIAQR